MTGRERLLTALNNEKPDRLPCQVHSWMDYYLKTYLNGMDQYQAYANFGMDTVAYVWASPIYDEKDMVNWQVKRINLGVDANGNTAWRTEIETPKGVLILQEASNQYTSWITEHIIKSQRDWELWSQYVPVPIKFDQAPWIEAKEKIGDSGILRGMCLGFGQGSAWQDFCGYLYGMEQAIIDSIDKPDWIHAVLDDINKKRIGMWERTGKMECDIIETGGGAGSSTVISPDMHRDFCLPYDRSQHAALHECCGVKIVYHLCGGLMPLLELVAENGADGLETMTPPDMGGDCDLAEAAKRVGDKLFFIGGFDQNAGFEKGTRENICQQVQSLHSACPDGGYICSPSDHFFFGAPKNIQYFVECVKDCSYTA